MSSCYNDALFMSESLAFYLSTNTFSNPMFEAQLQHENHNYDHHEISKSSNTDLGHNSDNISSQKQANQSIKGTHQPSPRLIARCANLCDNLLFSVRSKFFVLELNFKRAWQSFQSLLSQSRSQGFGWKLAEDGQMITSSKKGKRRLYVEKEMILSRLEQAVNAKRTNQRKVGDCSRLNRRDDDGLCPPTTGIEEPSINRTSGGVRKNQSEPKEGSSRMERALACCIRPNKTAKIDNNNNMKYLANWAAGAHQLSAGPSVDLSQPTMRNKRAEKAPSRLWSGSLRHGDLCVVCYTNAPNIVTIPCNHDQICSDCFVEIIYMTVKYNQYPLKCVLCRQKVERIRCSRKLLLRVMEGNHIRRS